MTVHQCHAVGCSTPVEPRFFMCSRHWRMVPPEYQKVIWHYYRAGQEVDKQPSIEYLAVAFAGIACVAIQEGRTPPRFIQRREVQPPIQRERDSSSMSTRILPWTCIVCNRAGDVSLTGDVVASSISLRRLHDGLSPNCKRPELSVVEDGKVITLEFADGPLGPVQTKVSAAYPD